MLTDHYDRNPKINLLTGRLGYLDSWIFDERETSTFQNGRRILRFPPKVIFVKYYDWVFENDKWIEKPCSWEIEGCGGPGIYPIKPWHRTWHLDHKRPHPK